MSGMGASGCYNDVQVSETSCHGATNGALPCACSLVDIEFATLSVLMASPPSDVGKIPAKLKLTSTATLPTCINERVK